MVTLAQLIAGFCLTIGLPIIVVAIGAYWSHLFPFVIGIAVWLLIRERA